MTDTIVEKPKFNYKEYMKNYNKEHKQHIKEMGEMKVWCDNCECFTRKDHMPKHKRTKRHISNVLSTADTEEFDIEKFEKSLI
jgi:hypothetical protein